MGCVSSKILMSKSGSFQEKVVANHGFQRSNLVEEIILSNSKSNGDQFLALLRTSSSAAARREKEAELAAADEPALATARIETINVRELLAGLEEEGEEEEEERSYGEKSSARFASDAAAGRATSFRTVEEFDALVTRSSSPEQAKPATTTMLAPPELQDAPVTQSNSPEQDEAGTEEASGDGDQEATATRRSVDSSQQEAEAGGGGKKRRARARQLGELNVAPAFDFSKSGSLRDWLLGGGQIFSPGSYVTPKFGDATPPQESEGHQAVAPPPPQQQQQHSVFDPELVAQFEHAMEQLSEDEERALEEILEAMDDGEENEGTAMVETRVNDRPVVVQD